MRRLPQPEGRCEKHGEILRCYRYQFLVSALLKWQSVPGQIGAHILTGDIIPLLNEDILREYNEVLRRPKFKFDMEAVKVIIQGIVNRGVFVDTGQIEYILPDPKDTMFYEVVMEHRKSYDSYLVTGNIKHFPVHTFIVTPREMLNIIEEEGGSLK